MSRGVRFTIREKERALKMWLGDHEDVLCVARKVKCTEQTLYRWKKRYDGTRESLQNKSSRPHTPHPNAHTKEEQEYIRKLFEEQPNISYAEALGILRQKYAYSRTYYGFYRYVVKSGIRPKEQLEKYEPQPYETPDSVLRVSSAHHSDGQRRRVYEQQGVQKSTHLGRASRQAADQTSAYPPLYATP